MKIAVPINKNMVNQHFGMSENFAIVTVEDKKVTIVEEISAAEFAHQHKGLADLLVKQGAETVIAGLQQNGLTVIKGATGEYMKVVEEYIKEH